MKAVYRPNLYLGSTEKNRIQEIEMQSTLLLLDNLISAYGLRIDKLSNNALATDFLVTKSGGKSINVKGGQAVIKIGDYPNLFKSAETNLSVPDSDGTYKVLLMAEENSYEKGIITLTNSSNTVTGIGTEFTKVFAINRKIIIDNVAYNVICVNSDTSVTIQNVYSGETLTGKKYKVGGYYVEEPLSINEKPIYLYNNASIEIKTSSEDLSGYYILLAELIVAGGIITTVTDKRSLSLLKYRLNVPDFGGTASPTFTVGGRNVLLEPEIPPTPQNVRIVDIEGMSIKKTVILGNKLNVKIKIGWDDITGTGGLNSFTVSNQLFDLGALVGHYLWIPQVSKNLKITANTETVLYVIESDGTDWNGAGVNVSSTIPAWVHPNAETYDIVAINHGNRDDRVEDRIFYAESPTKINFSLQLTVGMSYLIKVRSGRNNIYSDYVELGEGTFDKYEQAHEYHNPFQVIHPNIPTAGSISILQTRNGFVVNIIGWSEAENYEIVWTTKNSGADFEDESQDRIITDKTTINVPTNSSAIFNVGARPLIAMQQVKSPIYGNVKSGSSGQLPRDLVLPIFVNHKTYSGTITYNAGTQAFDLSSIKTPSGGDSAVTSLNDLEGCILTNWQGRDYLISGILSATSVELENLSGNSYALNSDINGTFTINVSKRGRIVFKSNSYPSDYEISRIDIDCDVKKGEDVTLRVYQEGKETSAAILVITQSDSQQYADCSVLVSYVNGARNIIVDLFDPASSLPKNKGSFTGLVTLYMTPQSDYTTVASY